MSAADEPASSARQQERTNAPVGGAARLGEGDCFGRRKKLGPLPERGVVLLDIVGERVDPRSSLDRGRAGMRRRHRAAERVGQRGVDPACIGQMVERGLLVEAAHLDRPFHRRAVAVEREPSVRRAGDRHHAQIDVRRKSPVDLELGLAGALALLEGRIIQERKAHRALDLEGAVAGEKHRGGMGVDALDRCAVMGRRVGEQGEDRLLGRLL